MSRSPLTRWLIEHLLPAGVSVPTTAAELVALAVVVSIVIGAAIVAVFLITLAAVRFGTTVSGEPIIITGAQGAENGE